MLAGLTAAIFVGGEALIMSRTDAGRLTAARYFHVGDHALLTRLVGKQIRLGLTAVQVSRDSVRETVTERGRASVRWRVGLRPHASLLQANYAITRFLDDGGAVVIDGREHPGNHGETVVTLLVGLPGRPTHEIDLVQPPWSAERSADSGGRLAVVLFGFGDDSRRAEGFFGLPVPFDVAIAPGGPHSNDLFRAARGNDREVVLHLPLEPIHYPQVDPGPGTILVTMGASRINGIVERYLDQAGPVVAVANHMGSLATQDMSVMTAVFESLHRHDVPFLHTPAAAGAVCKPLAAKLGVSYEEPDAILDAEARRDHPRALNARFAEVLKAARRRGRMIVMVRATPLVERWLPDALSPSHLGGVSVVPLSSILRRQDALSWTR
jgi:polysaccharide deacetylase 2 family uncharacterized protein YibQ